MSYLVFFLSFMLVMGVVVVACNPSPYFAALDMVLAALGGCGILSYHGDTFISLVLLLVYLGGMLVVFGYCAALTAEPYPEVWGNWGVLFRGLVYLFLIGLLVGYSEMTNLYCARSGESGDYSTLPGEFGGVSLIYNLGGEMLMICGWILLLTLLVVLELTRGGDRGALRTI
uniref:NADH dehydrogenase subunit 6 n=1 Tax=Ariosoma meeki TaxID=1043173 RepID=UPI0020C869FD|nr:NADH dehydrogenase subunit 6 [Ariosoma meeki]USF11742.1 NADH dehydrogenase subunit 6 [Ariosoma meeki]